MKTQEVAQFNELVRRMHAVLVKDPANELAQNAWRAMFKTLPHPTTLDDQALERLRDWFDERVDGVAPAEARSCSAVVAEYFETALTHIAAAECSSS